MLLKTPATRTPQGALKYVALVIKILSCNKIFFFHGLRSKLPQLSDSRVKGVCLDKRKNMRSCIGLERGKRGERGEQGERAERAATGVKNEVTAQIGAG
jgi:hypothetical protein